LYLQRILKMACLRKLMIEDM